MLITIFTPTYNREQLLSRLFTSLREQSFKDFEWLIVDDGSTDNTQDVVQKFVEEGIVPIKYVFKRNGGKHRAINEGVKHAKGELFFIVDSDDMLPPDALKRVAEVYGQIKDDRNYGGVAGVDAYPDGGIVNKVSCGGRFIRGISHRRDARVPFPRNRGREVLSRSIGVE